MLTWFGWGLSLSLCSAIGGVIGHFVACTKSEVLLCIQGTLITCGMILGNLSWFIAGQVIRWSEGGKCCSDDNKSQGPGSMTKSGRFLEYYIFF